MSQTYLFRIFVQFTDMELLSHADGDGSPSLSLLQETGYCDCSEAVVLGPPAGMGALSVYPFVLRKKMCFKLELHSLMSLTTHLGKLLPFMTNFNGHKVQKIHLEDYQSWQRTVIINQTQKITNNSRYSLPCIQTDNNDLNMLFFLQHVLEKGDL